MLTVDVNAKYLDSLSIDQLANVGCWLATVREISLSSFLLDFNTMTFELEQDKDGSAGRLERDITGLLDQTMLLFLSPEGYGDTMRAVVQGVFQGPVREKINAELSKFLAKIQSDHPCLSHVPSDDDAVDGVVWADVPLIQSLQTFSNEVLGSNGYGLNKLFSCATGGTGSLTITRPHDEVVISGLNSFYELNLFATNSSIPYDLLFDLSLGFCHNSTDESGCNPLKISVTATDLSTPISSIGQLDDDQSGKDFIAQLTLLSAFETRAWDPTTNFLSLSTNDLLDTEGELVRALSPSLASSPTMMVSLNNLSLSFDLLMQLSMNKMRDLNYAQLHTTGCMASTINDLSLQYLDLSVSSCQLVRKDGEVERDLTKLVNGILNQLGSNRRLARVNEHHSEKLSNAPAVCLAGGVLPDANIITNSSSSNAWKWQLSIVCLASLAALFGLALTYVLWGPHAFENEKERNRSMCGRWWHAFSLCLSPRDPFAVGEVGGNRLPDEDRSLLRDTRVPLWVRACVPLTIVGTMVIFLSSNTAPSAVSVMLEIVFGDKVSGSIK
jgi:hypothetical protein